jgi:hypothetical protein
MAWSPVLCEENQVGIEIPLTISRAGEEWTPASGIRSKFYFKKLADYNDIDMVLLPSAGMALSRDQVSLELQPLSLAMFSFLYRKDFLGSRDQYVGMQVYTMILFSWAFLPGYSISDQYRITRTIEPQYSLRWNLDGKYRIHEFGVIVGFWFPGFHAGK